MERRLWNGVHPLKERRFAAESSTPSREKNISGGSLLYRRMNAFDKIWVWNGFRNREKFYENKIACSMYTNSIGPVDMLNSVVVQCILKIWQNSRMFYMSIQFYIDYNYAIPSLKYKIWIGSFYWRNIFVINLYIYIYTYRNNVRRLNKFSVWQSDFIWSRLFHCGIWTDNLHLDVLRHPPHIIPQPS